MTSENTFPNDQKTPFTRVSMSPLYDRLLKIPFPDTVSAIEHCRNVCGDFGFTVKQEASANRNIYVYCSREGLPDSQRNPKPTPQRKRPSKRCDCRWRVVLSEDNGAWSFRKSMNPNASEHNHEMMDPNEMVKAWPPEVNDMIIYLAQQRLQTHEIRDAVKQRFPMISWNERRFYNRLTEERKRIRQRNTTERARRLIHLSSQLCAVVAANEEWSHCVESDIQRMFDNFCHLTRLTPESIPSLVDMNPEAIAQHRLSIDSLPDNNDDDIDDQQYQQMDSPVKKRKTASGIKHQYPQTSSPQQKGVQCVSVPPFNVLVRSQSLRSSSESSQGSRRTCDSMPELESPINTGSSFVGGNNGLFSLSSPTSSSSSSSSIPFKQHSLRLDVQQRLTTPPLQQHSPHDPSSFMLPQQQPYAIPNLTYDMQTSFSPYSIPTPSFSSSNSLPYALDNTQTTSAPQHLVMTSKTNQQHDHYQQERSSVFFNNFCPSVKIERDMYDRSTGYNNAPLPMIRSNDHPNTVSNAASESSVPAAYY